MSQAPVTESEIKAMLAALPQQGEVDNEPFDFDADPDFVAEFLKAQFVEDVLLAMSETHLNNNTLAQKLGKTRQYVGRILNERPNLTLQSVAHIAATLHYNVSLRMYPKDKRHAILPALTMPCLLDDFVPVTGYLPMGDEKRVAVKQAA